MDNPLTLAYSPCPNDTFIFAAWSNGMLQDAPAVRVSLEDVENLNNAALRADHTFTKVSYGAIPLLMDNYRILRAGGAIGTACGPLLVARPGTGNSIEDFQGKLIAIPGEMTTAFMLLRLAMSARPQTLQMRFDKIVEAVARGAVDAGLIIHESRFTYTDTGLIQIADLGQWWEAETGLPIPLGAILARSDIHDDLAGRVNETIRSSLQYARNNNASVMRYVREHATEMSELVMKAHIDLYVNEYTNDVGEQGVAAVNELFHRAHRARIIPDSAQAIFV
jgi:1,4-dihydroxy-6-naphthoate synthase